MRLREALWLIFFLNLEHAYAKKVDPREEDVSLPVLTHIRTGDSSSIMKSTEDSLESSAKSEVPFAIETKTTLSDDEVKKADFMILPPDKINSTGGGLSTAQPDAETKVSFPLTGMPWWRRWWAGIVEWLFGS